jgi:hypothetical protein
MCNGITGLTKYCCRCEDLVCGDCSVYMTPPDHPNAKKDRFCCECINEMSGKCAIQKCLSRKGLSKVEKKLLHIKTTEVQSNVLERFCLVCNDMTYEALETLWFLLSSDKPAFFRNTRVQQIIQGLKILKNPMILQSATALLDKHFQNSEHRQDKPKLALVPIRNANGNVYDWVK